MGYDEMQETSKLKNKIDEIENEQIDENQNTTVVSEWQVNQLSLCYNLPALALFCSPSNFF